MTISSQQYSEALRMQKLLADMETLRGNHEAASKHLKLAGMYFDSAEAARQREQAGH
jgi:hypothetical protein